MKQDIETLLPKLTVGSVISGAWSNIKGSKWAIWLPLISVGILLLFLSGLEHITLGKVTSNPFYEFMLGPIVSNFISAPFIAGMLMVAISHCRQQTIRFNSGFQYFDDWIQLGIAAIIIGLLSGAVLFAGISASATPDTAATPTLHWPFVVALLLNLILSSLFMLTLPAIADKRLNAFQAITFSLKKCAPVLHKIFGIFMVNALIMGVTFVGCIIPLALAKAMHSTAATVIGILMMIAVIMAFIWIIPYIILCAAQIYLKLTEDEE